MLSERSTDARAGDPEPADVAERLALLRAAAAGRREYAAGIRADESNSLLVEQRTTLLIQAATLDMAAAIMAGDDGPLYELLPSWRWTPEMDRALFTT